MSGILFFVLVRAVPAGAFADPREGIRRSAAIHYQGGMGLRPEFVPGAAQRRSGLVFFLEDPHRVSPHLSPSQELARCRDGYARNKFRGRMRLLNLTTINVP